MLGFEVGVLVLTCIITLLSAFPLLISYSVKVLSEPMEARTEGSEALNLIRETLSVEVVNVRLVIGVFL